MSKETHMNIVANIMFATGKATSIKQAVHMSAQIDESVQARLLKDSPQWAKVAKKGSRRKRGTKPLRHRRGQRRGMKHFPSAKALALDKETRDNHAGKRQKYAKMEEIEINIVEPK